MSGALAGANVQPNMVFSWVVIKLCSKEPTRTARGPIFCQKKFKQLEETAQPAPVVSVEGLHVVSLGKQTISLQRFKIPALVQKGDIQGGREGGHGWRYP